MAVDLQIDLNTGDLVWSPVRDLGIAQAENITQQRVHTRLMIERGTFIYDTTGTLGSRLTTLLNLGVGQAASSIEMIINEALSAMTDINVVSVQVNQYGDGSNLVSDPRKVLVTINYQIVLGSLDFPVSDPILSTTFSMPL